MVQLTFENCATCSHHYKDANGNIFCKDLEMDTKIPSWIKVDETEEAVYCMQYSRTNTFFIVMTEEDDMSYIPDVFKTHDDAIKFVNECLSYRGLSINDLKHFEDYDNREISDGDDLLHEVFSNYDIRITIFERELRGGDN